MKPTPTTPPRHEPLPPRLDELLRSNRAYRTRVQELEAANQQLRRDLQALVQPAACPQHGEHECSHCHMHGQAPGPVQALSQREREVLRLLAEGSRSPCIAAQLGICIATVEVHRRNIMRKRGLHTISALTKYAVREGLTPL